MTTTLETGILTVGDGARIYWERFGAAEGRPALFLHGGPGSGLGTHHRSYFDPRLHRVVALDQRGCGRSRPLATDSLDALATNTTQSLISDIEALRRHLDIDLWLVVGLSWGSTLALAYSEAHPDRVTSLVLGAVTTTSAAEVEWITEDLRRVFPREWDELAAAAGRRPGERMVDALYRRITDPDSSVREATAVAWGRWEDTHVSLAPDARPDPRWQDPGQRMLLATLVLHYWSHSAFLGPHRILDDLVRIAHLPVALVHGRLDVSSTLSVPWELHRRLPQSTLVVAESDGHFGETVFRAVRDAITRQRGHAATHHQPAPRHEL